MRQHHFAVQSRRLRRRPREPSSPPAVPAVGSRRRRVAPLRRRTVHVIGGRRGDDARHAGLLPTVVDRWNSPTSSDASRDVTARTGSGCGCRSSGAPVVKSHRRTSAFVRISYTSSQFTTFLARRSQGSINQPVDLSVNQI